MVTKHAYRHAVGKYNVCAEEEQEPEKFKYWRVVVLIKCIETSGQH